MKGKFFKVNPAKVFKKMYGFDPIPQHLDIFDSINSYRNTVVAATRRGGKTKSASAAVIAKFLEPNTETMILAPQHSLTDNIFMHNVLKFIRDTGIETVRVSVKDRMIEGINGSKIYARSLQSATSIVGVGLDLAVLDEIALVDDDMWWLQELQPTLTEKSGHTLWISTPRGYNHFKVKFDVGQDPEDLDWASLRYTIYDLPYIDPEEVKRLHESYLKQGKEAYFRQEFMASFEAFEGQIYSVPPEVYKPEELPSEFDMVIAGLDVGFNHSTAFVVIGYANGYYFILDVYKASGKTTAEHAEEIKKLSDRYNIDLIYIDYAAAQFAWDLVVMYDISTLKANKEVNAGIARIQTLLGEGRILVNPELWHVNSDLYLEFKNYKWMPEKDKPVKKDDDLLDALRYAIYTFDLTYNAGDEELDGAT